MKKKIKEVKKSFKIYLKLFDSLNLILNTMNKLVKNTKLEKYKLRKEQSMPDYGNSLIKIRNKHNSLNQNQQNYRKKASKQGDKNKYIETNSVSIGFLDSIKIVVWNKRKYFFRLCDYVSKIILMNQVVYILNHNLKNLLENFQFFGKKLLKIKTHIKILENMKFEIKKKSPLLLYNNIIVKFIKFQKDFCNKNVKLKDYSMGKILEEINQIEHTENDHDIILLKNM